MFHTWIGVYILYVLVCSYNAEATVLLSMLAIIFNNVAIYVIDVIILQH